MKLVGKVKSGFGTGQMWIGKACKIFEEKYGMKLFLGTLNIELDKPYVMESNEKILPSEYGGTYDVLVKECTLFEHKVYILRPEINNQENGMHPLKIIEIVSDINLRKTYNMKDGDEVIIDI